MLLRSRKYTILPSLVLFYNQYYREFFCGYTNLQCIGIMLIRQIYDQGIEHDLLLLSLKNSVKGFNTSIIIKASLKAKRMCHFKFFNYFSEISACILCTEI